jgi:RNA polymerase sigma factor (sigma-70 family)
MGEKLRRLSRTSGELTSELGREPTGGELAERLGWTDEEVRFAMLALPVATSLDGPVSAEGGNVGLGELLADEKASRVAEEVVEEDEKARLYEALARLPQRSRRVLVRRYGLDGEPATLREIAEELGVSHERVRQLQRDAEYRLRGYAKVAPRAKTLCGLPSVLAPYGCKRPTEREAPVQERKAISPISSNGRTRRTTLGGAGSPPKGGEKAARAWPTTRQTTGTAERKAEQR